MKNNENVDLSVILPVRNEADNVGPLVGEIVREIDKLGLSYEIIVINLPGTDNSWEVLKQLAQKYERVYPVSTIYKYAQGLQKGYQYMLGFRLSKGKRVIQMDADYQDNPADIPAFLSKLDEGYDLVVGWKQDRKDPFFYKLTSWGQNILSRLVTKVKVHDKNCGFKAYGRAAVDAVQLYGMNYRDIPMQLSAKGFKVAEVPIDNRKRKGGRSNFSFFNRLIGGTVDFLAALLQAFMGDQPFRFWGGIGMLFLAGGGVLFVISVWWLFYTAGEHDFFWWPLWWFSVGAVLVILGGIFIGVGAIAEYMRMQRRFSVEEYAILEDPKGIVEGRLT